MATPAADRISPVVEIDYRAEYVRQQLERARFVTPRMRAELLEELSAISAAAASLRTQQVLPASPPSGRLELIQGGGD